MSNTPNLNLPYLAAGQAQKHVSVNESLRRLDALVQIGVSTRAQADPPVNPSEGQRLLLPAATSGHFAGHAAKIAAYQDGVWQFYAPQTGWLVFVADEALLLVFNGAAWTQAAGSLQNLPHIGINATADSTSRLTVSAPATLLNHAGSGHQLKINKATEVDTAALLFQTGFSGRAELGLAGNDAFALKLSANGSSWSSVLSATPSMLSIGAQQIPIATTSGQAAMEVSGLMSGDRYAYFDFHASDTQPDCSARLIRDTGANGAFRLEDRGGAGIRLQATAGSVAVDIAGINRHYTTVSGLMPGADNAFTLGGSGARWASIWAANGVIQTSDKRDKQVASALAGDTAGGVVDTVEPVLFRWKEGGAEMIVCASEKVPMNPDNPAGKSVERTRSKRKARIGKRLHAGFLAQDVKAALDAASLDFSVWGFEDVDDPQSRQWLRPDQMIPLLWAALRETRAELKVLLKQGKGI